MFAALPINTVPTVTKVTASNFMETFLHAILVGKEIMMAGHRIVRKSFLLISIGKAFSSRRAMGRAFFPVTNRFLPAWH